MALVHAGAKEKQQIYDAFENIYAVLKMFKKGDVPAPAMTASNPAALVSQQGHRLVDGLTACGTSCCCAGVHMIGLCMRCF